MADKAESKGSSSRVKSPSKSQKKGLPESPTKKAMESPTKKAMESPTTATTPTKEVAPAAKEEDNDVVYELVGKREQTNFLDEKVYVGDEEGGEEAEGAAGSWSGWFSNTIAQAKEKSNEMLQYLKQDLSEFSDTVSEAGRDLKDKLKLEENANKAVTVVGEKMNVVLEQMSNIFGVGPDDDDEAIYVGNSGRIIVDRIQAKIYSLAMDDKVFLKDPEDLEAYELWMAHFDMESKNDEISELVSANPHLQLHYSNLVPEKVSHLVFWHRFYYQVHLIVEDEKKQQVKEQEEKKQQSSSSPRESKSDGVSTVDENNGAGGDQGMLEISEEDQKRLLAEYEEELKKGDESGKHSRRSSGTQLSSSSSGSFAFVTHDPDTNELKVE